MLCISLSGDNLSVEYTVFIFKVEVLYVMPYSLVDKYHRFYPPKKEAQILSEILALISHATRRHISADSGLLSHRREQLISGIVK